MSEMFEQRFKHLEEEVQKKDQYLQILKSK